MMDFQPVELSAVVVFFIGFYGAVTSKRVIKSIAAIALMEIAVVVFYLSFGFSGGIRPPIGTDMTNVADPLPQALMITAIIIGVAVTAINLTMMISISRRQHKTIDWDEITAAPSENE
jgi:multicomponent Na+:H+ antiporter subunit C